MGSQLEGIGALLPVAYPRRQTAPPRWSTMIVGITATAVLHALLIAGVRLGQAGATPVRLTEGLGADAVEAANSVVSTLIFVEEPGIHSDDPVPAERLASHGKSEQRSALRILSPEASTDTSRDKIVRQDDAVTVAEDSTGDRQQRARLFGMYIAQIRARIERTWQHPRAQGAAGEFDCEVQIEQSLQGDVLEVTLLDCPAELAWQSSLVTAIQRASPLPAPPDATVYTRSLQLTFHASAPAEGFSPSSDAHT